MVLRNRNIVMVLEARQLPNQLAAFVQYIMKLPCCMNPAVDCDVPAHRHVHKNQIDSDGC